MLIRDGLLKPDKVIRAIIRWYKSGIETDAISIRICTLTDGPQYMELNYSCDGKRINYLVHLTSCPSNIGKGVIWFFVCPKTGRRCRKLHLVNAYFYHRSAFSGCCYELQRWSHKDRKEVKFYGDMFVSHIIAEMYVKYFKTHYAKKETRRYQRLIKKMAKYEI